MEKWDEEGTEDELDEAAEDEEGGLVGPAAPIEEGARLGSATEEEWYAGSGVGRGSATERGPPSGSLQGTPDEQLHPTVIGASLPV